MPFEISTLISSCWQGRCCVTRTGLITLHLVDFGVKEVEYPDKSRFYFQAPGGQVFRLVPEDGGI